MIYREAKGLVRFLYDKGLDEARVLEAVRSESGITDAVRRKALALAQQWQPDVDPDELNQASWNIVLQTNAKPEQYQSALKKAETVCRLVPDNGDYLNTLGVAQYRVGQYQAAVDTLLCADRINHGIPPDLAFLAMAYHCLGQKQQAQATLTRLRKSTDETKKPIGEETRAFLREAETLIEGKPRPGK